MVVRLLYGLPHLQFVLEILGSDPKRASTTAKPLGLKLYFIKKKNSRRAVVVDQLVGCFPKTVLIYTLRLLRVTQLFDTSFFIPH